MEIILMVEESHNILVQWNILTSQRCTLVSNSKKELIRIQLHCCVCERRWKKLAGLTAI